MNRKNSLLCSLLLHAVRRKQMTKFIVLVLVLVNLALVLVLADRAWLAADVRRCKAVGKTPYCQEVLADLASR